MRMGVLTRYLVRAHIGPFLFALSAITGLIFLNAVAQRIEGLVGKGLSWSVVSEFLVLSLPHTIALSLPMAVLVAVLYAFSDLAASNEIMAMAAGGIRPTRVLVPLFGMGLVLTGVMLFFNDQILPEANHRLKNLLVDIGRKSPTFQLREQVVNEIKTTDGLYRYFLTASRIDPVTNELEDVTIFDANDPRHERTTYAARGTMAFNAAKTDLYLTLYDGVVNEVESEREGGFQRLFFQKQIVPLRGVGDELERQAGGTERGDREMGFRMLRDRAAEKRKELASVHEDTRDRALEAVRIALGRPAAGDSVGARELQLRRARGQIAGLGTNSSVSLLSRDDVTQGVVVRTNTNASRAEALREAVNRYEVELHKKWAIAFACLVFTLIGPPIALRFPRGGVGLVIAASTFIFSIYWVGLIGGESLADKGLGDPIVTMWIPNVIFTLVGVLLVRKMGGALDTPRGGGHTRWRRSFGLLLPRARARAV